MVTLCNTVTGGREPVDKYIDADTQRNITALGKELQEQWSITPTGDVWTAFDGEYKDKTSVSSESDALNAFDRYTPYFKHVLSEWESKNDVVALLPCGSKKPIGASSIHQKKLTAIRESGLSNVDVVVISEPCGVVPPEYRLSLPAVNYEFPPVYTSQSEYESVFDVFVERLTQWIDETEYETILPYLIQGHQEKFDAAVTNAETNPTVVDVPGASYNPDTDSFSGDRFKSQADVTCKMKAVVKYSDAFSSVTPELPSEYDVFYQKRLCD